VICRQHHRAGNPLPHVRAYSGGRTDRTDLADPCRSATRAGHLLRATTLALAAVLFTGLVAVARADTLPGSPRAHEALALCDASTRETDRQVRLTLLGRGLAAAESAVGDDDADAAAHFAVFCNLGRQLQLRSIGLLTFFDVRRVRREIDRALELAPRSPGVLTAKGLMLIQLPRLLGGDTSEGERLIRRALELAPDFEPARRALAGP
jgi:hypothetical protein